MEKGLEDALNLSRATLEIQMREHMGRTDDMAHILQDARGAELATELARLQQDSGATEITVVGRNSRIVASISDREELISADRFPRDFYTRCGGSYPKQVITYHIPFTCYIIVRAYLIIVFYL